MTARRRVHYYIEARRPRPTLPREGRPQADPALLTLDEYLRIVDPTEKTHPPTAYDFDVASMNSLDSKENYPTVLRRLKVAGLDLELRLKSQPVRYVKKDAAGDLVREGGELQYWTDEEARRVGRSTEEHTLALFDGDNKIASVQDEWGTVLVVVAREYRNLGLGTLMQKLARTMTPTKSSGGFTPAGRAGFARVHREFVREALAAGRYSKLIRAGTMTAERVRDILRSARIDTPRPAPPAIDLRTDDPRDWLLYAGEYGDFILYDRKIRDLLDEGDRDYFIERMIRGAVNVRVVETPGKKPFGLLTLYGGETPKIRAFLLRLALSLARREKVPLYVEPAVLKDIDAGIEAVGERGVRTGMMRQEIRLKDKPIDYRGMARDEAAFRAKFDRYREFHDRLLELAVGKYG